MLLLLSTWVEVQQAEHSGKGDLGGEMGDCYQLNQNCQNTPVHVWFVAMGI